MFYFTYLLTFCTSPGTHISDHGIHLGAQFVCKNMLCLRLSCIVLDFVSIFAVIMTKGTFVMCFSRVSCIYGTTAR